MHEQLYKVELLSDVSITADSATTGSHNALDYIPGASFMGAAIQAALAANPVFDPEFFLSGKVRFSDALPAVNGKLSFPVPLAFHYRKGETWKNTVPLFPAASTEQLVQMRAGYLNMDGEVFEPEGTFRVKTAVDRDQRRALDGNLFSCGAIPSGTACYMRVQAENQEYLDKVACWFDGKVLRVGRSKGAEYGRIKLTKESETTAKSGSVSSGRVSFLLVSDLALENNGQPTLLPKPKHFGLTGGSLIKEETFLRARRYSPWNANFRTRMTERQVLCKGGVITFSGVSAGELPSQVGLFAEEGLGRIAANPTWLLKPPTLKSWAPKADESADDPVTPLTAYLSIKSEERKQSAANFVEGISWAKEFRELTARIGKELKVPGKSQWGAVRAIAASHISNPNALLGELNEYCDNDLRAKMWNAALGGKSSVLKLLREKVSIAPDANTCRKLVYASIEMQRLLGRKD
jgi:CRISPR-associated protein Csx10